MNNNKIENNKRTTALARQNSVNPLEVNFKNRNISLFVRFYFPSIIRELIEIYMRGENICN